MALLLFILLSPELSLADSLVRGEQVQSQPQIARDEKGFSQCGLRFLVADLGKAPNDLYDFSLVLYRENIFFAFKAGKYRVPKDGLGDPRSAVVKPAPSEFWIALGDSGESAMPSKYLDSTDKGFVLGVSHEVRVPMTVLYESLLGKTLHFRLKYASDDRHTIVSFTPKVSSDDAITLKSCFSNAIESIKGVN